MAIGHFSDVLFTDGSRAQYALSYRRLLLARFASFCRATSRWLAAVKPLSPSFITTAAMISVTGYGF